MTRGRILIVDENRVLHDEYRKILESSESDCALIEQERRLHGEAGRPRSAGLEFRVDSAYDGQEAVRRRGVDPWGAPTGGEERDYGDAISEIVLGSLGMARAQCAVLAISDPVATRHTVATARRLMTHNLTTASRTTADRDLAGRRLWVYRRAGRPCARCGTHIEVRRHGDLIVTLAQVLLEQEVASDTSFDLPGEGRYRAHAQLLCDQVCLLRQPVLSILRSCIEWRRLRRPPTARRR